MPAELRRSSGGAAAERTAAGLHRARVHPALFDLDILDPYSNVAKMWRWLYSPVGCLSHTSTDEPAERDARRPFLPISNQRCRLDSVDVAIRRVFTSPSAESTRTAQSVELAS